MKNIQLIPTDKPSRLLYFGTSKELTLQVNLATFRTFERSTQHIYITSDEEIKEEGYVFWEGKVYTYREFMKMRTPVYTDYFSIILTTDQDLINNGVQKIDDEFLEWFVKNPSCEEVDLDTFSLGNKILFNVVFPKDDPKQETLEEVAENYDKKYIEYVYDAFIDGAKWQQERMYSEEEVLSILKQTEVSKTSILQLGITKWFEQFKKKQL